MLQRYEKKLKKESKYKLENLKSDPKLIDRCCGVLLTRAQ